MKSKGYLRFCNRIQYFKADSELIEMLLINKELLAGTNKIFNGITVADQPIISAYANTPHARKLAITHLRTSLYVSYIKEIYEEVTEYLRYALEHCAKNGANINRLVGEQKVSFDANFLLSTHSFDAIARAVTDSIFQQLENEKSTLDLIKKINTKLDLQVPENIINEALPYLLIRHIYVHSDGKPKKEFKDAYPFLRINGKGRIELTKEIIANAKTNIETLLNTIDQKILAKGFFPDKETQA